MAKKNMKKLHSAVRERENNNCQICKRYFEDNACCAHHLQSRGARPDLWDDPNNCILVCLRCHNLIHNGEITINKSELAKRNAEKSSPEGGDLGCELTA